MTTFYATPYNLSAQGFYFESLDEYTSKYKANKDDFGLPVEEYEIQYIDSDINSLLFDVCSIDQCNLSLWYEIEQLSESEQVELYYRCAWLGQSVQEALGNLTDDGYISECSVVTYVHDLAEDTGMLDSLQESLRYYFDYQALAHDMELNGEITEFDFSGNTYTAIGF